MKKHSIIAFIAITVFTFAISDAEAQRHRHKEKLPQTNNGQDSTRPDAAKNTSCLLTIYPTSFFISTLKAGVEFRVGPKTTLKFIPSFATSESSGWYNVKNMTEFALQFQPRFYVTNISEAFNGFYMAPFVNYKQMDFVSTYTNYYPFYPYSYDSNSEHLNAYAFTVGYMLGYQHVAPSGFTIDIFAGGGINVPGGSKDEIKSPLNEYKRGIYPQIGIAVGFAL